MSYFNTAGYWLGLQQTTFAVILTLGDDAAEAVKLPYLYAWALLFEEFALRVLRCGWSSAKDPCTARLMQQIWEENAYLSANSVLDEWNRQMDSMQ